MQTLIRILKNIARRRVDQLQRPAPLARFFSKR